MRHSVTPEQVVAFIGLLFAGPGYDTDPCRRIRSNVEGLKTDFSDQGRERLAGNWINTRSGACVERRHPAGSVKT
ncbi:hypothetical protein ACWKWK_17290 [Pseudoxanthomonas beigongshangi]